MKKVTKYIVANNEEELQKLFLLIQEFNSEQYRVINVYPKKGKVYMWFYASTHTITDIKLKGSGN